MGGRTISVDGSVDGAAMREVNDGGTDDDR